MYDEISAKTLKEIFGDAPKEINAKISSLVVWQELKQKFNVFYLHKPYFKKAVDNQALKQWRTALGKERILNLKNPKACVDVMLGAIAITSGQRTMQEYIHDMENRGQTQERVIEVAEALAIYASTFDPSQVVRGEVIVD